MKRVRRHMSWDSKILENAEISAKEMGISLSSYVNLVLSQTNTSDVIDRNGVVIRLPRAERIRVFRKKYNND